MAIAALHGLIGPEGRRDDGGRLTPLPDVSEPDRVASREARRPAAFDR